MLGKLEWTYKPTSGVIYVIDARVMGNAYIGVMLTWVMGNANITVSSAQSSA